MNEQLIDVFGTEYIISPIENWKDRYSGPTFCFSSLGVFYEICQRKDGKYSLNRCPDSLCRGISSDFTTLKSAVEFADIYERMVIFTFFSDESKDNAIEKLKSITENELPMLKVLSVPTE